MSAPTTDSFPLLRELPWELQYAIQTFTFLLQMEIAYSTKDYNEMARQICIYANRPQILLRKSKPWGIDNRIMACWLTALLDVGVHIPSPPLDSVGRNNPDRESGATVFHIAAEGDDIQLIRRLVRLGYDINAPDSAGDTAIVHEVMLSCRQPSMLVVQTLCEEGADIKFSHEAADNNVLYQLIRNPYTQNILPVMKVLVNHGASLSRALHAITYHPDKQPLSKLIEVLINAGADIEELYDNCTPLAMAAAKKNVDAVQALLDAGANVDGAGTKIPLFTAIEPTKPHYVYAPNTAKMASILCKAGADTTRLYHGRHVLCFALISSGYETKRYSSSGWDSVSTVVKALCEGGVDVNVPYSRGVSSFVGEGDTPLHIASEPCCGLYYRENKLLANQKERSLCVGILISHGADINSQNHAGRTPLHLAAMRNELRCVTVLVEHGAKLDVKDSDGMTALNLAAGQKCGNVVDFLTKQEQNV